MMRVRITFLPKCQNNAILPLDHHPFQALIYHSLAESAPDYADALHQQGYGGDYSTKRFRLFVFSRCYLPDQQVRECARVKDGHLVFPPGPVEQQVCSPAPDFIQTFVAGLATKHTVTIRNSYAAQRQCQFPRIRDGGIAIALNPRLKAELRTPKSKMRLLADAGQ
jgi:CRISPR/Cas system endoribonuclease Cas6 (RAMP superfamily)